MYSLGDSHRKSRGDSQFSMAAKLGTARRFQQTLAISLATCKLMQTFPVLPETLTGVRVSASPRSDLSGGPCKPKRLRTRVKRAPGVSRALIACSLEPEPPG